MVTGRCCAGEHSERLAGSSLQEVMFLDFFSQPEDGIRYYKVTGVQTCALPILRRGPNVVGPFGLLQTTADAMKFLFKEVIIPAGANKVIFFLAPLVSVMVAFIAWAVIPFNKGWVVADINVGILYLFAVSSLGVYGTVMVGWASNSKYTIFLRRRAPAP